MVTEYFCYQNFPIYWNLGTPKYNSISIDRKNLSRQKCKHVFAFQLQIFWILRQTKFHQKMSPIAITNNWYHEIEEVILMVAKYCLILNNNFSYAKMRACTKLRPTRLWPFQVQSDTLWFLLSVQALLSIQGHLTSTSPSACKVSGLS